MDINRYKFPDVIDVPSLQDIQDKFAKIVGFSSFTVDEDGIPIVKPSNFSRFCNLIRSSKAGNMRCMKSDARGGINAMHIGKPVVYYCHSGLTDVAAPIIVNDYYMGSMLCGQVIVREFINDRHINLSKLSRDIGVSKDELKSALNEIPIVEYDRVKDASDFLFLFANFIAKMGVANVMHRELVEQVEEKLKLERLLKDMELKALQAQINPHFLFNTLNTIARMALIEGANKTEDLIYTLSDLLRSTLGNIDHMVDIESEINSIKKYLSIQKVRYEDRMSYEIAIHEEILRCKIPSMTLQPIVENSIVHGLEPKKEKGRIEIKGRLEETNRIIIDVTDNGIGIDEKKLDTILKINSSFNSYTGLGILNVNSRLKHYFGSEYGLNIKSRYGLGTTVSVIIPYEQYETRESEEFVQANDCGR